MTLEVKEDFQSHSWKDFPDCEPITREYIDSSERLQTWISEWPNERHLLELSKKRSFSQDARELLVNILSQQYRDSGLHEDVPSEIATLLQTNTFTICTGHQLCLLGGPSFIWVKLAQLCKMAKAVNENQNDIHIVPIFWLASEDHDIAEISSVTLFGKDFVWSTSELGATGKLSTTGIHEMIEEINSTFPQLSGSQTLELIREAYSCDNLANAWRRLIHRIAGYLGIVVIDGNDSTFKSVFSDIILRELKHGFMYSSMQNRLEDFKTQGFQIPVNPRECCLFYLREGYRGRIIRKSNDSFETAEGSYQWSLEEILNEARVSPEYFSPNVLMRPLYQESILPNLLYLAGPSELSYWLQLKPCFEEVKMDFPLLHLRSGLTMLSHSTQRLMLKWDLTLPQLFQHSDVIMNRLIRKDGNPLYEEIKLIEGIWTGVLDKATDADVTLKAAAEAELHRIRESVQRIESKMIRAEKRKNSELSSAISKLQEVLFPGGKYQERAEGMLAFQPLEKRILERLMQQMNAWASEMILMKWEN